MYFKVVFTCEEKVICFTKHHIQCLMCSYQQFFLSAIPLRLPHSEYLISHINKERGLNSVIQCYSLPQHHEDFNTEPETKSNYFLRLYLLLCRAGDLKTAWSFHSHRKTTVLRFWIGEEFNLWPAAHQPEVPVSLVSFYLKVDSTYSSE